MKMNHSIMLTATLFLLSAGIAQAETLFSYNFENLTSGQTIVGQDNWVSMNNANRNDAWVGTGAGDNTSKMFTSVDDTGTTSYKISDARRPFDTALTFSTADTEVVFSFQAFSDRGTGDYDYTNLGINMWDGDISGDLSGAMGMYYKNAYAQNPTVYFRDYAGTGHWGDTLVAGHWYDMKYTMDFSDGIGKITLEYRDITAEEENYTTDSVVQNMSMKLTFAGGQFTFDSLHAFAQPYNNYAQHAFIDNIEISKVPEPSTLVMLGCGLIGLLAYAWRKRK